METEPSRLNPANPEKSNIGLNPKSLEIKSFTPENPCCKDMAIVLPPLEALAEFIVVLLRLRILKLDGCCKISDSAFDVSTCSVDNCSFLSEICCFFILHCSSG